LIEFKGDIPTAGNRKTNENKNQAKPVEPKKNKQNKTQPIDPDVEKYIVPLILDVSQFYYLTAEAITQKVKERITNDLEGRLGKTKTSDARIKNCLNKLSKNGRLERKRMEGTRNKYRYKS